MTQTLHHSERLELLYMLDRDNKIPKSKAVCSGCADTHNQSLFSLESLAQSSRERHCLGSAGRLWICPHWVFDHNLITTSARPHWSHTCGGKGWQVLAPILDYKKVNCGYRMANRGDSQQRRRAVEKARGRRSQSNERMHLQAFANQ